MATPEAAKRRAHAASYGMGPKTYREHAANLLQGDQTQYDWLSALMLRHFGELLRSDDRVHYLPWFAQGPAALGYVYGYTPESRQTFQSFRIEYAIKKTIAEHYEKTNY